MQVTIESSDEDDLLTIAIHPNQCILGKSYEVQKPSGDIMKLRLIDKQESSTTTAYRFDVIATVRRQTLTLEPTDD